MSSLEADPSCYDPDDWQLLCTEKPYDASKYQIDLVAGHLEREQQRAIVAGEKIPIRHFIAHPGVVRTNIAISTLNSVVLDYCMQLAFLIVRTSPLTSSWIFLQSFSRLTVSGLQHMFGHRINLQCQLFTFFSSLCPSLLWLPRTSRLDPMFWTECRPQVTTAKKRVRYP